jgi:hypothetical protein
VDVLANRKIQLICLTQFLPTLQASGAPERNWFSKRGSLLDRSERFRRSSALVLVGDANLLEGIGRPSGIWADTR